MSAKKLEIEVENKKPVEDKKGHGEFHNKDCKKIAMAILNAIRKHPINMGEAFEHAGITLNGYAASTMQNYYYKKDELVIGMSLKEYALAQEVGFVLVDSVTMERLAPINVKTVKRTSKPLPRTTTLMKRRKSIFDNKDDE